MKIDLKHVYPRFKKQIIIAGTVLLIVVLYGIFGGSTSSQVTLTIHSVDFTDSVLVSGKIVSAQKSDLGFDQSGRISAVYVKVGDVVKKGTLLASVDNTDLVAQVAQKKSALDIQQAKLDTLITGNRPEEITLYQQKYADASDALLVAHHSAFLGAQDALLNKADTLFTNGNTVNPVIAIRTQSTNEKLSIEQERIAVRDALISWESILTQASSSTSSLTSLTTKSTQALSLVKTFLSHLSVIVGNLS
ncbi:MAG: biotin/lipoyl-binding protein, partial [Candidatus Taylorbacteria bacterium]